LRFGLWGGRCGADLVIRIDEECPIGGNSLIEALVTAKRGDERREDRNVGRDCFGAGLDGLPSLEMQMQARGW
jgi:hypothetical protein